VLKELRCKKTEMDRVPLSSIEAEMKGEKTI
jgi:hypothetical protein